MAGRKAGSPSRSDFIRKFLTAKPEGKLPELNEAWKKSGQSGEITPTLFYQVKSKSGLGKRRRRRGRPPGRPGRPAGAVASTGGSSGYAAIEHALDSLIATAEKINDQALAHGLRLARRHASAKLV